MATKALCHREYGQRERPRTEKVVFLFHRNMRNRSLASLAKPTTLCPAHLLHHAFPKLVLIFAAATTHSPKSVCSKGTACKSACKSATATDCSHGGEVQTSSRLPLSDIRVVLPHLFPRRYCSGLVTSCTSDDRAAVPWTLRRERQTVLLSRSVPPAKVFSLALIPDTVGAFSTKGFHTLTEDKKP